MDNQYPNSGDTPGFPMEFLSDPTEDTIPWAGSSFNPWLPNTQMSFNPDAWDGFNSLKFDLHQTLANNSSAPLNQDGGADGAFSNNFFSFYGGKTNEQDLGEAASNGRDLYAEALARYSAMYDPFGTTPLLKNLDTEKESVPTTPKPTYSEVAKNRLITSTCTTTPTAECAMKDVSAAVSDPCLSKPVKSAQRKSRTHAPLPCRASSCEDVFSKKTRTDSRYGLDNFEKPVAGKKSCFDSPGSVPNSRKGSTSSVGSSTSGIEEIQLRAPLPDTASDNGAVNHSHPTDTKPAAAKNQEKVFFDPKRIFAKKELKTNNIPSNQAIPNNLPKDASQLNTALNNGQTNVKTSLVDTNTSGYIKNDLRDKTLSSKKSKNTDRGVKEVKNVPKTSNADVQKKQAPGDKWDKQASPNSKIPPWGSRNGERPWEDNRKHRRMKNHQHTTLGDWLAICQKYLIWGAKQATVLFLSFVIIIIKLVSTVCILLYYYSCLYCDVAYTYICEKIKCGRNKVFHKWSTKSNQSSDGFEENIKLPSTGEEAMQRLLACKGKDPYGILGLKTTASDDDIRKYYRRQAFLVHPDKNQQPGAEEAFKILGHAFELIGDPQRRLQYDTQRFEATELETAMKGFTDLLGKLHEKMQEAANTIRCDHCGNKHRRIPVQRPWYSARWCSRCNIRHSAKEGDVWAESRMMGFLWHYYSCMEGTIYDITEWASCQKENFKHMQSNAHHVIYRISTGHSNKHHSSGEGELHNFLNTLYKEASRTEYSMNAKNEHSTAENNLGKKKTSKKETLK